MHFQYPASDIAQIITGLQLDTDYALDIVNYFDLVLLFDII